MKVKLFYIIYHQLTTAMSKESKEALPPVLTPITRPDGKVGVVKIDDHIGELLRELGRAVANRVGNAVSSAVSSVARMATGGAHEDGDSKVPPDALDTHPADSAYRAWLAKRGVSEKASDGTGSSSPIASVLPLRGHHQSEPTIRAWLAENVPTKK